MSDRAEILADQVTELRHNVASLTERVESLQAGGERLKRQRDEMARQLEEGGHRLNALTEERDRLKAAMAGVAQQMLQYTGRRDYYIVHREWFDEWRKALSEPQG